MSLAQASGRPGDAGDRPPAPAWRQPGTGGGSGGTGRHPSGSRAWTDGVQVDWRRRHRTEKHGPGPGSAAGRRSRPRRGPGQAGPRRVRAQRRSLRCTTPITGRRTWPHDTPAAWTTAELATFCSFSAERRSAPPPPWDRSGPPHASAAALYGHGRSPTHPLMGDAPGPVERRELGLRPHALRFTVKASCEKQPGAGELIRGSHDDHARPPLFLGQGRERARLATGGVRVRAWAMHLIWTVVAAEAVRISPSGRRSVRYDEVRRDASSHEPLRSRESLTATANEHDDGMSIRRSVRRRPDEQAGGRQHEHRQSNTGDQHSSHDIARTPSDEPCRRWHA
jgi:hypothetical protein